MTFIALWLTSALSQHCKTMHYVLKLCSYRCISRCFQHISRIRTSFVSISEYYSMFPMNWRFIVRNDMAVPIKFRTDWKA